MMLHIVLWKWAPEATPTEVSGVLDGLARLAGVVPGLRAVRCGENTSKSAAARGNTHYSILTFDDEAAFTAWHDNDDYKAWSAAAKPIIGQPTVLDIDADFEL